MTSVVISQVIAGCIVGVILLAVPWLIRRIAKSMADDIKSSIVASMTSIVQEKVNGATAPILSQFGKNGGSTLKDGQDRIEVAVKQQALEIEQVKQMTQTVTATLGEHISFHMGQESRPVPRKRTAPKVVAPRKTAK